MPNSEDGPMSDEQDKALRFDLDRAGIESRERDAVELVDLRAEVVRLKAQLVKYEQDYRAAATEFRVPVPEPGTDAARLMIDARLARKRASDLETENLRLLAEIDDLKRPRND